MGWKDAVQRMLYKKFGDSMITTPDSVYYRSKDIKEARKIEEQLIKETTPTNTEKLKEQYEEFKRRINSVPEKKREKEIRTITPQICGLVGAALQRMGEYDETTNNTTPIILRTAQYSAGMAMSDGNIAELPCGEGKTIAIAIPAIIHTLEGRLDDTSPVHVVTSNEYLARRDVTLLSKLYESLGLEARCMPSRADYPQTPEGNKEYQEKVKEALRADITYGTITQLGFQDLEEQFSNDRTMRIPKDSRRKRTIIIDEIDDVLLDKALIGLNLSGAPESPEEAQKFSEDIRKTYDFAKTLKGAYLGDACHEATFQQSEKVKGDYVFSYTNNGWPTIAFSEKCIKNIEEHFKIEEFSETGAEKLLMIRQAIIALLNGERGREYIEYVVDGDNIVLVDSTTGRSEESRRIGNLLHSFIEAKEGLTIKQDTKVWNQTSIPLFLEDSYGKIIGTTGTSSKDLKTEYGLETIIIPPAKRSRIIIEDCGGYKTKEEKYAAIAEKVVQIHETGDPVLVDALGVKGSEEIYQKVVERLRARGIDTTPTILNATTQGKEEEIVRNAGTTGSIMIASQMAGRGTDIKVAPARKLHVIISEHLGPERLERQAIGRTARQGKEGTAYTFRSEEDTIPTITEQEKIETNNSASRQWATKLSRIIERSRKAFIEAYDNIKEQTIEEIHEELLGITTCEIKERTKKCTQNLEYVLNMARDAGITMPEAGEMARMISDDVAEAYAGCLKGGNTSRTIEKIKGAIRISYHENILTIPNFTTLGTLPGISTQGVTRTYIDVLANIIRRQIEKQRPELVTEKNTSRKSLISEIESIASLYAASDLQIAHAGIITREVSRVIGTSSAESFLEHVTSEGTENTPERLLTSIQEGCKHVWKEASIMGGKKFGEEAKRIIAQNIAESWRAYLRDVQEIISTAGIKSYGGSEEFIAKEIIESSSTIGKRHFSDSINKGLAQSYTLALKIIDDKQKNSENTKKKHKKKKAKK